MSPFVLDVVDGVRVSEHSGDLLHRPPSVWNGHPLTCQRCGNLRALADDLGAEIDPSLRCPDCVDGHPIIEMDVPCDWCHGNTPPEKVVAPPCHRCHGTKRRSVRVSVQAVPIEHNAASPRTQPHVAVSTVYEPNGEAFLWVDADTQVVEVDIGPEPLSQIGRFAIIATPEGDDQ